MGTPVLQPNGQKLETGGGFTSEVVNHCPPKDCYSSSSRVVLSCNSVFGAEPLSEGGRGNLFGVVAVVATSHDGRNYRRQFSNVFLVRPRRC